MLFGFSASQLFEITNRTVLPAWLFLILAPRFRYTPKFVVLTMFVHALLYLTLLLMLFSGVESINKLSDFQLVFTGLNSEKILNLLQSFGSLQQIAAGFGKLEEAYLGWVHYLVMDLGVALYINHDSNHKLSHFFVVPCLFFTLMFGPCGFLMYTVFKLIFGRKESNVEKNLKTL